MIPAPIVTVAIPLYNAEPYIETTIRSILGQTYHDFELIVYDDCSTDRSAALVAAFTDPRIKLVRNVHNLGPEGNWNRCFESVRGKFLKIVCGDDVLAPECLERQVAALEDPANAGVGIVCCARRIIDHKGRKLMVRGFPGATRRVSGAAAMRQIIRRGTNLLGEPVAVTFRSDLVGKAGKFRAINRYLIDLDYWIRLLAASDLFVISEPLASFRISATSWSSRIGWAQYRDFKNFALLTAREHKDQIRDTDLSLAAMSAMLQFLGRMVFFKLLAGTT